MLKPYSAVQFVVEYSNFYGRTAMQCHIKCFDHTYLNMFSEVFSGNVVLIFSEIP